MVVVEKGSFCSWNMLKVNFSSTTHPRLAVQLTLCAILIVNCILRYLKMHTSGYQVTDNLYSLIFSGCSPIVVYILRIQKVVSSSKTESALFPPLLFCGFLVFHCYGRSLVRHGCKYWIIRLAHYCWLCRSLKFKEKLKIAEQLLVF